jgi:uncharacterized membrane protein
VTRNGSGADNDGLYGGWSDQRVETILGNLLRTGVIVSAAVVAFGAAVYLSRHGGAKPDYEAFRGEPSGLRSVGGIIREMTSFSGRGIIQLGLLLLIATPMMRVVLSFVAFLKQRDKIYMAATLLVFAILLYSLIGNK